MDLRKLKILKRERKSIKRYIVLNENNTVKREMSCDKSTISELVSKFNVIAEGLSDFSKKYEGLTREEVEVIYWGDMKIDLESKTIKVENVNEKRALVGLANIG